MPVLNAEGKFALAVWRDVALLDFQHPIIVSRL
jgi:hypothetical protein